MIKKSLKSKLATLLLSNYVTHRLYLAISAAITSEKPRKFGLYYNPEDVNVDYYNKIKGLSYQELEHQIGRFSNFKTIIKNCASLDGDFVEFGTWKGFSLLWIAYFMERNAVFDKKLIGLDSFIGLPYSDGSFIKYGFSNTSLRICSKNIYESSILYPETKKNILIAKYLFKQKDSILSYFKLVGVKKKFCFIHVDCDVSQSAVEIFDILVDGDLISNKCYILFDDYNADSNLKHTVDKILSKLEIGWNISVHSQTKITKNFYLTRK